MEKSQIIVTDNIENEIEYLKSILPLHFVRVIANEKIKDTNIEFLEFQIEQAKLAIKEAYLATSQTKYIILAGSSFNIFAQNSLLKILEEPPKNIIFIIVTNSKSSLLPTIHSRLPSVIKGENKKELKLLDLNFDKLDLNMMYDFLQEHQKISKSDAKELIESIYKTILLSSNIKLSLDDLNQFDLALKLLELNSKPINILSYLLLTLLNKNKKV